MQEEKQGFGKRFSALFSSLQQKARPEEEPEALDTEPALQPTQDQVAPPAFFDEGPRWRLELPSEGTTWGLWGMWNEELEGTAPNPPVAVMDQMPEGKALLVDETQMEGELKRLRTALESRAAGRMKLAREQQKRTDSRPSMPTEYVIHMSQSGAMAWMMMFPPMGSGELPLFDGAMTAIRRMGINTGVEVEELEEALRACRYFTLFPFAWGTLPVEGKDGRVVEYFSRNPVREPVMDEQGNVDYREANYVQTLHKGDVICDLFAPEPGTDGVQVTGKVIKAKPVQAAKTPNGRNTTVTEDGAHLVASLDGHLEFLGGTFQIKSILDIPGDVDYATGNINFFGDVHIGGDVRENFTVRATGSVTIDGLVEAATVEADGNIIITKGVLGDTKALIRSRKTVRAKYLENCSVYAGESVFADCIIASQVFSDDRVSVISGRGTIIGGCVSAANLVEASVIGSKAGRRTEVVLGHMTNSEQERQNGVVECESLQQQLDELARQIPYLEDRQDIPENVRLLSKLRLNKSVLGLKLEKLTRRLSELEGRAPQLESCRMRCGTVYPVTNVTIGTTSRIINNLWASCTARYDPDNRDIMFV